MGTARVKRAELEHIIRAAAGVADDDEIVVIGSQAILGPHPDAPDSLTVSAEADVYPKNHPERWNLIDGTLGEGSPFHETFGVYAQGVGPTTATLPRGWASRLVRITNANTGGAVGLCLETHDLVVSKCVAGRAKDERFVRAAVAAGLVEPELLRKRVAATALEPAVRAEVERRVEAWVGAADGVRRDGG